MPEHYLEALFAPQSVAVVGASERAGALGNAVFANLLAGGFKGALYPVNPKYSLIHGKPAFSTLRELPEKVDLAVIVTPAAAVAEVLREVPPPLALTAAPDIDAAFALARAVVAAGRALMTEP